MASLALFSRLILRPLLRERLRTALMVLAVALGVAVVLAIELAGQAAAGSFRSSMETLSGREDFAVTAAGGLPAGLVGHLATIPYPIRLTPRIEAVVTIPGVARPITLLGLDLVAAAADLPVAPGALGDRSSPPGIDPLSVLIPSDLGPKTGETIDIVVNDRIHAFPVAGTFGAGVADDTVIIDLAGADRVLQRGGRIDRLLVRVPDAPSIDEWESRLRSALPAGVVLQRQGAAADANRRMLSAFRWNLRVLSYVALIVGGFLIYNAISVSVVRRRPEIGIVRALGASRPGVMLAFLVEAAVLGLVGSILSLPIGLLMASGAVGLLGATVQSLYVSSTPGAIVLTFESVVLALGLGTSVAVLSAMSPAREASFVSPVDAMGRGRREFLATVHKTRDLGIAAVVGAAGVAASRAGPVDGVPLFGYLSALLLVASCALAIPAFVHLLAARSSTLLHALLGVEALLAARSLSASLRRTSVLVGALATAVAMSTAVGIMVGSFRATVLVWLEGALPAHLYVSPAGFAGPDRRPTLDPDVAGRVGALPGVAAVDRFRAREVTYAGMPATLGSFDARVRAERGELVFLSGRSGRTVLSELPGAEAAIVSEPFADKHGVGAGDVLALPLGGSLVSLRVADVYYDYSGERGVILVDRGTILKYLPDPAPSTLAVYLERGADTQRMRAEVGRLVEGRPVAVVSNREIRGAAIGVFDRTFAITYALEAVSVVVAVMGIAGALIALVIDRRRELALLRFLGGSKAQVRRLILVEAGLLGLLSNAAGLALGVVLSLLLVFVINKQSFGWTIQFHPPVMVLAGALTLVYAATLAAGLYPARAATRLNPIEVIHEE